MPDPDTTPTLVEPTTNVDDPADNQQVEATKETSKVAQKRSPTSSDTWIGYVFWLIIIFWILVVKVPPMHAFFWRYWWESLITLVLLIAVIGSYAPWRQKIRSSVHTRVGSVIVALAGISILEGAISVLPQRYQILALRSTFLLVVCLFPVILYYLFITTRKYSLLNEFITNLERLGLLRERVTTPRSASSAAKEIAPDSALNLRILTYLQKFEAVYGSLDPELVSELVAATDPAAVFAKPEWNRRATAGFSSIFTPETTAPLVTATGLIALGWILALPPWQAAAPQPLAAQAKSANTQVLSAATPGLPTSATGSTETPLPAKAADAAPSTVAQTNTVSWLRALYPDESPVYFAFLGAYFFSIQMLFRRYVLKDLRSSAYVAVSLRIVMAVMGTWVMIPTARTLHILDSSSDLNTNSKLLVLSFVIGVFPPVIWQFLQAAFKKISGARYFLPSLSSELPLSSLDGLTVWHEARLEEEDIENVPNMATASIVDLMLYTRFSPDRIIDWIDQSILYTQLGPDRKIGNSEVTVRAKLRSHGIRTATALLEAYRKATDPEDKRGFEAILESDGRPPIRTLTDALLTSPNLDLVRNWRALEPFAGGEWVSHTAPVHHNRALAVQARG
ncbi:hypothetical protein Acid345_2175 [Candidatus Koribacter versatilis Ellin345]|uniref:Uncharacterized protein n=1 Tax=Koribacter versatilis (strain Ellin345) TaxID=204669 RepID=Q1IPM4_KORVE|nr:hypothetical protein [Candidatus Koribacter versatilis]ABF41176.1 hypothetical protein Acid345_2175 [Candidatus Koribacter versatilis Ellin345]